MRRLTATSLLVLVMALFLVPSALLAESFERACCRRTGVHHCAPTGGNISSQADSQPSLNRIALKCPLSGGAGIVHAKVAIPALQSSLLAPLGSQFSSASLIQVSTQPALANLKDRGPPSLV